jgi:sarcosine oxidase
LAAREKGTRQHYDVAVVGCGAMGSAVSYNLAKRGVRAIALDRYGLGHDLGSSHGRTRIIRLAYYEDTRYVPLLRRAFDSWRELEGKAGRELLRVTGGLMIGAPGGELVTGVIKSARTHGIPHRVLSAAEVEEGYEAFAIEERYSAVLDESAGVLYPEECIRAFVDLGGALGCEFRFSEPVVGWRASDGRMEVETSKGRYSADKVVVCAGPWTSRLLGDVLPLSCERQVPFWFSSEGESCFEAGRMPVFIMEEEPGLFFYGVPELGHGVKVARSHGGEVVEPDGVDREVHAGDSAPVEAFVSRRLPKLGKRPIASTTCLYTNTPDMNFAVGLHPREPRVVVVSACSGHGFKFASVLGEAVADLVTEGRSAHDISFLNPDRFAR